MPTIREYVPIPTWANFPVGLNLAPHDEDMPAPLYSVMS